MPKGPYKSYEIGKYARFYDGLSEKKNDGESIDIGEVLSWLEEDPSSASSKSDKRTFVKRLVGTGAMFTDNNVLNVIRPPSSGVKLSFSFFDNLYDTIVDLYYAGKDTLAGKKVKTSLTITAGVALGAGAGFAIGTFLLPVVGSAIGGLGGAAAGIVAGGVAYLGGTIGLTILGAASGSWIASKISKKIFKHEKRFEISKRKTKSIRKHLGIDSEAVELINGYLYNRSKAIKSPMARKYYSHLRRLIINRPDKMGLKKAADFFMHELTLLERQRKLDGSNPALDEEIKAIVYILKKISQPESRGMTVTFKNKIKEAYAPYETQTVSPPVNKEHSVLQPSLHFDGIEKHFQENLGKRQYTAQRTDEAFNNGDLYCRYKIFRQNENNSLADIDVHQRETDGKIQAEFMVDSDAFKAGNKSEISELLVLEAAAYFQQTGNTSPVVFSDGDDTLAVHLMAAAIKAGLTPRLDDEEYPEDTIEAKDRKISVIEEAYRYAGRTPPENRSRKVGFRTDH